MKATLNPIDPDIELLEKVTYAKDQPEYIPLTVRRSSDGEVVTCWKMNLWARIVALFTGKVYFTLLTFNQPLQPMRVAVQKPEYRIVEMPIEDTVLA